MTLRALVMASRRDLNSKLVDPATKQPISSEASLDGAHTLVLRLRLHAIQLTKVCPK